MHCQNCDNVSNYDLRLLLLLLLFLLLLPLLLQGTLDQHTITLPSELFFRQAAAAPPFFSLSLSVLRRIPLPRVIQPRHVGNFVNAFLGG